jgi:hypothetical protein
MTSHPPSRAAAHTLADLLRAIAAHPGLASHRRRDLASAVRRVAALLGRDPEQIEADPRLLARRLREIAPAAHRLSPGRWNNIRSLLGAALALVRTISPGRHRGELNAGWQALADAVPVRGIRRTLSRFLHFCSDAGIAPGAVDEAVLGRFAAHLETSLLKAPAEVLRNTRRAWTRACREVPGWPDRPFAALPRSDYYALPWSSFPASLRADLQGWLDRLAGRDPLEETPCRPVRPATLLAREGQVRRFASALVLRGRDPASLRSLADLVEVETYKEGLRFFLERRGGTSSAIADLAAGLKAIARHWVGADAAHLARMAAMLRRLEVPRRGLTEANRRRLRALGDPDARQALLQLPRRLLALAERPRQPPRRAALLAQTALAVELLLMAPVRGGNLASIDLERHLDRRGRSRSEAVHLVFEAHEVKNRECLDFPLPPETVALLDR